MSEVAPEWSELSALVNLDVPGSAVNGLRNLMCNAAKQEQKHGARGSEVSLEPLTEDAIFWGQSPVALKNE